MSRSSRAVVLVLSAIVALSGLYAAPEEPGPAARVMVVFQRSALTQVPTGLWSQPCPQTANTPPTTDETRSGVGHPGVGRSGGAVRAGAVLHALAAELDELTAAVPAA